MLDCCRQLAFSGVWATCLLLWSGTLQAETSAVDLLPEGVVLYAELSQLDETITSLREHPLWEKAMQLDGVDQAYRSPDYLKFQVGLKYVEMQLGKPWHEALADLTQGGVTIAVDGPSQGGVVLLRAKDEASLNQFRDTFV